MKTTGFDTSWYVEQERKIVAAASVAAAMRPSHRMLVRRRALDELRRDYLDSLIVAAGGDLSITWQDAQQRLDGEASDA